MPNQFYSPEGDLERYFITESWIIDQYIGDQLWGWGNNFNGRLGANDISNKNTPITTFTGGTNWNRISLSNSVASVIKTDGTLWVWGHNYRGSLGNNDSSNAYRSTPLTTFIGGTDWKQVSVGTYHNAAVKTDGTLWIWGSYYYGELGINDSIDRSTPVTTFVGGNNWKQVSCGTFNTAAIKTDGTLWVWGNNYRGSLGTNDAITRSTPVPTFAGGTDWKAVKFGNFAYNVYAIKTDGTLWVWGNNYYRQLGLGINDSIDRSTPVTTFAGGTDWKQVAGSNFSTTALKNNGTVWTWGNNYKGKLGIGVPLISSTPVTTFAGGTNWADIPSGYPEDLYTLSYNGAIKQDGTLWMWGKHDTGVLIGTLGTNDNQNKSTPVTTFAGGTDWRQISSAGMTAAIKTDGTLWTWGNGNAGRLGRNSTANTSTPVTTFAGGTNWKQVSCNGGGAFAIKTDGTLWAWGVNSSGQLGNNSSSAIGIYSPVTTFAGGTDWKQVSGSVLNGAAIKTDGTLWIWGRGAEAQLGNNSATDVSTPVTTFVGGVDWKQVESVLGYTTAIKTDGTLWIWGTNANAVLGTNDSINRSTPVTTFAGGTDWKQVSATNSTVTAIKTDGTLWVWGNNSNLQLGINDTFNRSTPVTTFIGGTGWKQVKAFGTSTSAVYSDGINEQIYLWGNNSSLALGTNDTINRSTPVTTFAGGNNWADTPQRAEDLYTIFGYGAIKTDGTLWTWGTNSIVGDGSAGRLTPVTILTGGSTWAKICSAGGSILAIKTDGTLWGWGSNANGRLGLSSEYFPDTTYRTTPVTTFVGGNNWKQIVVGNYFSAAIKTDGTLWTWGTNQYNHLGRLSVYIRSTPVTTFVGGTNWADTATGAADEFYTLSTVSTYSAAIKTDGTLWTWGNNDTGQLGDNSSILRVTPITTFAGGTNWKQLGLGNQHITAIKTDGTLWVWGNSGNGRLGINLTNSVYISTPVTTFAGGADWKQVSAAFRSTGAVKTNGTLWMWGVDVNGTLGQGGTVSSFAIFTPVTTFAGGADWKQVSCGYRHTAAVKTDGTLWAWGEGGSGRLGNNDSLNNRSTPVTTFSGGTNWKQVSCSYDFTTAVKTDGTLWVWGNNSFSKLGNNETSAISRKATPITTFAGGANWKQVSADCNTNSGIGVAAVKTDGTLWLWGSNSNGQLGNTDLILRSTPITTFVGGTNWKQVCYSDGSTLSLNDNGVNKLLYGFGNNYYGNLGFADGTSFKDVFPTQVEGNFSNWKQVSCSNITGGADPVAAIKTDGTLWVWGNSGSLGTNDTINKSTPVTTFAGGTNWNVVHCATNIMSAIKTDGTLWTWGTNSSAQLGTNDTINKSTPVTTFAGGTNWKQISSAGYSCAAIKTDGTLWVWGNNSSSSEGRLGTNDTINKSTPVTTFAGGSNWTQANMIGYANLILLKTDGTLWLTGSNNNAEFGDNNNKYCIATQIYGNSSDYKQITSNAAIKTDGTLWVWGNNSVPGTTGHLGINDTITQVKITPVTTFAGGNDWKQVESLITNTNVSFMAVKTGLSPQLPL